MIYFVLPDGSVEFVQEETKVAIQAKAEEIKEAYQGYFNNSGSTTS